MKETQTLKLLLLATLFTAVAGCKLQVISPTGGQVTSLASGDCAAGFVCDIEITAPDFSESFTALPEPGYEFEKWNTGGGFFCAGSTAATCMVTLPGGVGGNAIIALFASGSIMPVYKDVGFDTDNDGVADRIDEDDDNDGLLDGDDNCPLQGPNDDGLGCPDTDSDGVADYLDACPDEGFLGQVYENGCRFGEPITHTLVDTSGIEWAFPADFRGLDFDAIAALCPYDPVSNAFPCSGELNGYDMEGWNFARTGDVYGLYTRYLEAAGQVIKSCDFNLGPVGGCAAYDYLLLDDMVEDGFAVQQYEYEVLPGAYYFAVAGWSINDNSDDNASKMFAAIVQVGSSVILLDSPAFTCGSRFDEDDLACAAIANNPQYTGAWFYRVP